MPYGYESAKRCKTEDDSERLDIYRDISPYPSSNRSSSEYRRPHHDLISRLQSYNAFEQATSSHSSSDSSGSYLKSEYCGHQDQRSESSGVTTVESLAEFNHLQYTGSLFCSDQGGFSRELGLRQRSRSRDQSRNRSRSRSPERTYGQLTALDSPSSSDNRIYRSPASSHYRPTPTSPVYNSDFDIISVKNDNDATTDSPICTCPITYKCARRLQLGLLDCRPLVAEWKSWSKSFNEDMYIRLVSNSLDTPTTSQRYTASSTDLAKIVTYLNRLDELPSTSRSSLKTVFENIEEWIYNMHESEVTPQVLVDTQVLERLEKFLDPEHEPIRQAKNCPTVLEEELTVLFRKWRRGDLSSDPDRGLLVRQIRDQNSIEVSRTLQVDRDWPHHQPATYFGAGQLVNGQTFNSRQHLMRDGVHAALQAGIAGTVKEGARSIVMGLHDNKNKKYYADIDMGDVIEYEGTALSPISEKTNEPDGDMDEKEFDDDRDPTACTRMMMKSFETRRPVRVIRSSKLSNLVVNKPRKYYRYDGLYKVVRMTPQKKDLQIWSFRLERLSGQGPLRGFGQDEAHPPSRGRRAGWKRYSEKYNRELDRAQRQRRRRTHR